MFCITLSTLVWGRGEEGPIYFVSACQMMLKLEFFPRVLSKIAAIRITEQSILLTKSKINRPSYKFSLITDSQDSFSS